MMRTPSRNLPKVVLQEGDEEEDGILKKYHPTAARRGKYCAAGAVLVSALVAVVFVMTSSTTPNPFGSGGQMMSESSCTIQDCSLQVISIMKNGKKHACKEFCIEHLEWTKSNMKPIEINLEGSFQRHGVCDEQQELVLIDDGGEGDVPKLIQRESKEGMPDYASIISSIQGKTILIIGDSVMKQTFEVLPMVLPGAKIETTLYLYNASAIDSEPITHCDLDFKSKTQSCRRGSGDRFACNCTSVATISVADHTYIQYAQGYGIEFENSDGKEQVYGQPTDFNILKPSLYKKLAETASAIVFTTGVLTHVTDHDEEGYSAMVRSVKRWSGEMGNHQKLLFGLAMPQHFPTKKPHSTYLDEDRDDGGCVEVAERHWSHALALKALHGSDVDLIDTFPFLSKHGHFHSKVSGNCGDWCLGVEMFYVFWKVLAEAVA